MRFVFYREKPSGQDRLLPPDVAFVSGFFLRLLFSSFPVPVFCCCCCYCSSSFSSYSSPWILDGSSFRNAGACLAGCDRDRLGRPLSWFASFFPPCLAGLALVKGRVSLALRRAAAVLWHCSRTRCFFPFLSVSETVWGALETFLYLLSLNHGAAGAVSVVSFAGRSSANIGHWAAHTLPGNNEYQSARISTSHAYIDNTVSHCIYILSDTLSLLQNFLVFDRKLNDGALVLAPSGRVVVQHAQRNDGMTGIGKLDKAASN